MSDFGQQPPQQPGQPVPPPPGYMPPPPPSYQSYAQPAAPAGSMAQQIVKASFLNRAGASIIDFLILVAVMIPLLILLSASGSEVGATILVALLFVVLSWIYNPFFESRPAGATPGKMVTGTRVVKLETGARLTVGQAFLRQLSKFVFNLVANIPIIGWVVVLLNYLSMLWDPAKMTWHDKMSKTVVVPKSVYPPAA